MSYRLTAGKRMALVFMSLFAIIKTYKGNHVLWHYFDKGSRYYEMNLWNDFIELLIKGKDLILGLSAEQITLISVVVTLVIFMAGQRSETKYKKHEVRSAEYKKFIELLQKSLSGGIKPDEKGRQEFFDTGVSLLL